MPKFRVSQYELHVRDFIVTAEDSADAVIQVLDGDGTADDEDNSAEFLEPEILRGTIDSSDPVFQTCLDRGIIDIGDLFIPTIRGVEELTDSE
jgi:hypothetical protein